MLAQNAMADLEAETITMSLIAIFIYVIVRLKMIMAKKNDKKFK
jgi:hypothetical protein